MTKNEIATIVNAVLAAMGQNAPADEPFPKTSAKVKSVESVSEMAAPRVLSNDANTVDIVLTNAMITNRMKLPRRMFGSKDLLKIDGNEFRQDEADQGRSLKFDPAILGAKRAGQTLRFTFEKQTNKARYYDVQVIGKGQKSETSAPAETTKTKTTKAKSAPAPSGKVKKTAAAKSAPAAAKTERVVDPNAVKIRNCKSVKSLIEVTGAIVIENEAKGLTNENIKSSGTFIDALGQDVREFLPTAQSQAFRMTAKKLGLGLKKAVSLLNDEYDTYE